MFWNLTGLKSWQICNKAMMLVLGKQRIYSCFSLRQLGNSRKVNNVFSSNLKIFTAMSGFCFSNLSMSLRLIGNSNLSQLRDSACFGNFFVIRSAFRSTEFNALATHHLKHWLSSFFMLTKPKSFLVQATLAFYITLTSKLQLQIFNFKTLKFKTLNFYNHNFNFYTSL